MKYFLSTLIIFLTINSFSQKDCHPECNITFEQLFQMRCPPFTKAASDNDCYKKVMDKLQEFKDEDMARFNYLRNVACSHANGWVEITDGACNAGGPPPCCEVQHWVKNPNAWATFKSQMNIIYNKREKQIQDIYYGCAKNLKHEYVDNFNNLQNQIGICLDKLRVDTKVYTQAAEEFNSIKLSFKNGLNQVEGNMQPAEILNSFNNNTVYPFKDKICNYTIQATINPAKSKTLQQEGDQLMQQGKFADAEKKYDEASKLNPNNSYAISQKDKAHNLSLKQQNNLNTTNNNNNGSNYKQRQKTQEEIQNEENARLFEEKKKQAADKQNLYNKQQNEMSKAMYASVAAWVGFYMFNSPKNDTYNKKGFNFTIGPTNSFISAPAYLSHNYIVNYSNNTKKEETEGQTSSINTLNFGAKAELNYYANIFHIQVPIKGGYGLLFNSQNNVSYGLGLHLFFGMPNVKKLKLGVCIDYNYNSMFGRYYSSTTNAESKGYLGWVSETEDYKNASFGMTTFKFGLRYNKHFNTSEINKVRPFVFDLFFTLNNVSDKTYRLGFNNSTRSISPGIEFNLNKIGLIGLFGKVVFMSPVGQLDYKLISGSVGENTSPYFEIGIKRDYSWFKKIQ